MRIIRRGWQAQEAGFSLLEVLIAVVVLSVGLLALAALQGSLTRASAEAKVRGRVAAMLAARMDDLRHGGYGTLTPEGVAPVFDSIEGNAASDCDPASPDAQDWLDCARTQANLGELRTLQEIRTWQGTSTFAQSLPANANIPQFKRILLTATWTDTENLTRTMQLVSDVSSMALTNNIIVPPEPTETGGGGPIVRTTSPATAGVIPIALSTQSDSATSNPVPELVGRNRNQEIVGTRFSVLNYTPPGTFGDSSVVIQKRFENEVVKCRCRYGAGGTNLPSIYQTAQWPAIWTGDRYDVHVPDVAAAAPGQTWSAGPQSGVEQSALCQECCRDHHDNAGTTDVRFDPERGDGVAKYDVNGAGNLVAVNNTNNGNYVDSCRMIRIDGFWRTAADLYQRQYGLLETTPVSNELAKSGLPTTAAVSRYTTFAKDFLSGYDGSSALPPTDAQALFVADTGFDVPTLVTIPNASNSDYRYMHTRGLYVDHLETKARTKLTDVRADTGARGLCPTGTPTADCVLPYLPFTTANLTEIATWAPNNTSILAVNSGNLLATDPTQPSGGRTIGKTNGSANNVSTMRQSNSGVAVSSVFAFAGVDPTDAGATHSDLQPFQVGGSTGGPTFDVRVTGGGGNPFVFFTLGSDSNRECLKPAGSDHHCVTSPGTTLPQSGTLVVSNYWIESLTSMQVNATCNGQAATATINVPTFRNYAITSATIGGVGGTVSAPTNDGRTSESTSVIFSAIPMGALLMITLGEQAGSPTFATITSCTTNGGGNKINNPTWYRPWTL